MFISSQVQKFNSTSRIMQLFLIFLMQYSLIFANVQNTTALIEELNMKQQEIFFLHQNNSFTPEPSYSQLKTLEETKFKRKESSTFVRDIYKPGHTISPSHKCLNKGSKLKLLILIISDPWHYNSRKSIRETWGIYGKRKDVKILFFLGSTTDNYLEIKLTHEQKIFNDIIRSNIYDSYTNLTLKSISLLEWVDKYCSRAKYILKSDDDVFINMPRLLTFVRIRLKLKNVIFGRISPYNKPHRDKVNKYYVPVYQYKLAEYPSFVTGPAYLLSGDTIHRLYEESLNTIFLKLEDVFLTGIVAEKLQIKRINRPEFVNQRISFNICEIQKSISLHSIKPSEQYDIWERLFDCIPNCPYFCTYKSSTVIIVKNNFILIAITICTSLISR